MDQRQALSLKQDVQWQRPGSTAMRENVDGYSSADFLSTDEKSYGSDQHGSHSEVDSDDLSPLEYARLHGLTTSYFHSQPLEALCLPSPPDSLPTDADELDDTMLHELDEAARLAKDATNEPWDIDKETAEFLASVLSLGRENNDFEDVRDTIRFKDLKIDDALLLSDPELDLSKLRARNAASINAKGVNPCTLDNERGEGLAWMSKELRLPATIDCAISTEKLDIDRETVELLREVVDIGTLDRWDAVELAVQADQVYRIRHETPPLLPLSPPLSPYHISTAAYEMELTSTPEDLAGNEAAELEAQLLTQDNDLTSVESSSATLFATGTSHDTYDFTKTPTTSSSSPLRQKRLRDLKADTPMLHQDPTPPPAKRTKTVTFPEELHTLIPAPGTEDLMTNPDLAHQDFDAFVADVVTPMAQSVIDELGNEQLDELDTVLRVGVPTIDEIETMSPWRICGGHGDLQDVHNNHRALLSRIEKEVPQNRKKWPGLSKLERALPWTPFPRYLAKITLDEEFDDGSCERYMAELTLDDGNIDLEPLTWKPEGLRLMDPHESDDEEVVTCGFDHSEDHEERAADEPTHEPSAPTATVETLDILTKTDARNTLKSAVDRVDMQTLLQKRKLELEAANKSKQVQLSSASRPGNLQGTGTGGHKDSGEPSLSMANSGLASFLGLQGADTSCLRIPGVESRPPHQHVAPLAVMVQPQLELKDVLMRQPLPSPKLVEPTRAMSIVVSSNMLTHRHLVRQVQTLLPSLDLIERDFTNVAPASLRNKGQDYEADFILSAGTGILCTTLQKLNQRPLPGQSSFFGIRERIAAVAPRYERLLVLVSEGKQYDIPSTTSLTTRDTEAIADLIGHVSSLDTDVEVCYIAGGESELAEWIAASICRSCPSDEAEAKLLHDETMWERLLRTAGANPSAAQTILAMLKRSDGVDQSVSSSAYGVSDGPSYGLAAFASMSEEERVLRFAPVMGGGRVLSRISEWMDSAWMSIGWK